MNNGWKRMIQAPVYSMSKDLSKPHTNCNNWRFRNLTFLTCSARIRVFLASIDENRWPTIVRKVIGRFSAAQKRTRLMNCPTAIEELKVGQWEFARFTPQSCSTEFQKHLQIMNQQRKSHKYWWNLDEMMKKGLCEKWRKLRELENFVNFIWIVIVDFVFCYD